MGAPLLYLTGFGSGSGSIDAATPPADTSESVAAGVGLGAKTFSAFTGDGASSIASYQVANVQASGSCTWSGSGLGPYTPSDSDGDSGTLYLDAKDSSGNVLGRAVHSYDRAAAAGGAAWTTVWEVDFTTDITDLTVTRGGGDTTLYEADGTTPKAVVGFADRIAGAGGSLVCTSAAGGLLLTTTGSGGDSQFGYIKITESDGPDWDDGKLYALDIITDSIEHGANTAYILIGVGNNVSGINSGYCHVLRTQRVSASNWTWAGRTRRGATSDVGSTLTTDSSQPTQAVTRTIIDRGGDLLDLYFDKGTTYLSGTPRPTTGASLWNSAGGTAVISVDDKSRFSPDPMYILFDTQVYGGTMTARILKARLQRLD